MKLVRYAILALVTSKTIGNMAYDECHFWPLDCRLFYVIEVFHDAVGMLECTCYLLPIISKQFLSVLLSCLLILVHASTME